MISLWVIDVAAGDRRDGDKRIVILSSEESDVDDGEVNISFVMSIFITSFVKDISSESQHFLLGYFVLAIA